MGGGDQFKHVGKQLCMHTSLSTAEGSPRQQGRRRTLAGTSSDPTSSRPGTASDSRRVGFLPFPTPEPSERNAGTNLSILSCWPLGFRAGLVHSRAFPLCFLEFPGSRMCMHEDQQLYADAPRSAFAGGAEPQSLKHERPKPEIPRGRTGCRVLTVSQE